jgi:hypothetical protein
VETTKQKEKKGGKHISRIVAAKAPQMAVACAIPFFLFGGLYCVFL